VHARQGGTLEVVQDRLRMSSAERARVMEALEAALKVGRGRVDAHQFGDDGHDAAVWRFSSDLHCADCDIHYAEPTPSLFSFNSPIGACEACRGFGRVIGVDYGLVIPDESKTLDGGAIKPWQTESYRECQDDMVKMARRRGVPLDVPWRDLDDAQRRWVIEGDDGWVSWRRSWPGTWYGVKRFFAWLETKAYKMHIRVLLSRYRAYTPCEACDGARLKPDALLWRLGERADAERALGAYRRFRPRAAKFDDATLAMLPGLSVHDLMLLPIERCRSFFDTLRLPAPLDQATDLLLTEIRARLAYLGEVGLGYLTLDRQSRTLSGGEVQRINLTTALGTALVNTLFVLDEPSIGLHPRDMGRVIDVMRRLREAGNSLVVVEHDPQIMFAADRLLDMGPGPGERGGEIVFFGPPAALQACGQRARAATAGRGRRAHRGARRDRAQPQGRRRRAAPEPARVHHRCLGLGQVDARAGRPPLGAPQGEGQTDRSAGRAPGAARRGADRCGGARRSDADRQDDALESCELRRCVRRDPEPLRRIACGARTRVHAGHVQLQRRQRPLPDLRRQRVRARRDAVPVGCLPALSRLRRQALSPRGPGGEMARPEHRRRPRADRLRGARTLRG
jgi:excinuclease ABC subunit A